MPRQFLNRPRWFTAALVLLFIAFGLVLIERNVIRSYWWAYRLAATDDLAARGYYLACIASIGDDASGAARHLGHDQRSDVRLLAVYAIQRLAEPDRSTLLRHMLEDTDHDVCEAAALTLAFLGSDEAMIQLNDAVMYGGPDTACFAVAALGRLDLRRACAPLMGAAGHRDPMVRAEALTALADLIRDDPTYLRDLTSVSAASRPASDCDPFSALVKSLVDHGVFSGSLNIERQIDAAASAVQSRKGSTAVASDSTRPANQVRQVAEIAAARLSQLTHGNIAPMATQSDRQFSNLLDECRRRFLSGPPVTQPIKS